MTEIPTPSQVAAQAKAAAEREQERERVKAVRKRRRARRGAHLTTHISDETAAALAKLVHPETQPGRKTR